MQSKNDFFAQKPWKVVENPERNGTLFSVIFHSTKAPLFFCLVMRTVGGMWAMHSFFCLPSLWIYMGTG